MNVKIRTLLEKNRSIMLIAGVSMLLASGLPSLWAVLINSAVTTYKLNFEAAALVFSFTMAAFGIGAVVGGRLQDKIAPRFTASVGSIIATTGMVITSFLPEGSIYFIYLFFGVFVGLGCSFIYPTAMSCVQKWYADKKGFATGVVGAAVGLSSLILANLARLFLLNYSLRVSIRLLALFVFTLSFISAQFMVNPVPKQDGTMANAPARQLIDYKPSQILRTRQFYIIFLVVVFAAAPGNLMGPVIVSMGTSRGLTEAVAVQAVSLASLANGAGRLIMPWLGDKIGRKNSYILLTATLIVAALLMRAAMGLWLLPVYAMATFCAMGENGLLPSTVVEMYGYKNSGANYGMVAFGMTVGAIVFPLILNLMGAGIMLRLTIVLAASVCGLAFALLLTPVQSKRL